MTERATPEAPLAFSLETRQGELTPKAGPPIQFTRVLLVLRNEGSKSAKDLTPHLSIHEGDTLLVDDGSSLLERAGTSALNPGEEIRWDLYDLLMDLASGFASKVHLFGIKSVLNWEFRITAAAEGKAPDGTPLTGGQQELRFAWRASEGAPSSVDADLL